MGLLQDKIVVIAGASRGIGRAAALECARQGARAHIVLHYPGDKETQSEVKSLESEIETIGCKVVTAPGDIAEAQYIRKQCAFS